MRHFRLAALMAAFLALSGLAIIQSVDAGHAGRNLLVNPTEAQYAAYLDFDIPTFDTITPDSVTPKPVGKKPFQRFDIIDGGAKYNGGFEPFNSDPTDATIVNINTSYWFSLVSLGLPGWIIGVAFFLFYILFLFIRFCMCCCCKKTCCPAPRRDGYSTGRRMCLILLISIFAMGAIAGTIEIFVGGPKMADELSGLITILDEQVNDVISQMGDLIDASAAAADLSSETLTDTDTADVKLQLENARDVVASAHTTFNEYLDRIKLACIIIASVFCAYAVFCLASSALFRWRGFTIFLLVIMPFFVLICWIIFGASFLIYWFVNDFCGSLDQYRDVFPESPLGTFLPCPSQSDTISSVAEVQKNIETLIEEINTDLAGYLADPAYSCATDPDPNPICEMFTTPRSDGVYELDLCDGDLEQPGSIPINSVETVYADYKCDAASTETECLGACTPITTDLYDKIVAASDLLAQLPAVVSVLQCEFVDVTFNRINDESCTSFLFALKLMWQGFLLMALGFTCLGIAMIVGLSWLGKNLDADVKYGEHEDLESPPPQDGQPVYSQDAYGQSQPYDVYAQQPQGRQNDW